MKLDAINNRTISPTSPRRWPWLLLGLGLGLTGITAWGVWQFQGENMRNVQADATQVAEVESVTALGRLDPEGEMIQLTAPTSTQEGRVDQLMVQEGDRVQAKQIVAILDSRDRLQAALESTKRQVQIAQSQLAQVKAGAKSGELQAQQAEIARLEAEQAGNLSTQKAAIARLEAEVQNAQIEYQRYESLHQKGAISTSERDAKQLTYTTSQRQLQEAKAALQRTLRTSQQQISQARATLEQIAEVRQVDITAANAEVKSAIAAVAEAKANLEQAYVRSPRAGQVIKIHTRPGEEISNEGIMTLGQTDQMMVIADIYQNDINQIQVGQQATITSPAIPDTLQGTVERIGLQVKQQEVVNEDPAANIDAKVVEVHIRLNQASSPKVAGLSNLQVTVKIKA